MSKKTILALSLLASTMVAGNAYAANPAYYVSGNLQYLFSNDDKQSYKDNSAAPVTIGNDSGYGMGAAVGAKLDNFRGELEFGYLYDKVIKANGIQYAGGSYSSVYAYMANAFYDFKNSTAFTPYLGGGLGVAHGKFGDGSTDTTSTDNELAYQLMTGVSYDINKNNTVYIGYRFIGTNDFKSANQTLTYERNSIETGYRYSF